jgi:AraC-like DNA-binding protein
MAVNLDVRSYRGGGSHAHPFAQVLFPLQGSMRIEVEGAASVLSSNRLAIIPRDHVHDFAPSPDCRVLVMDVDQSSLDRPQVPAAIQHGAALLLALEPWLCRLFRSLGEEIGGDPRVAREAGSVAMAGLRLVRPARRARPRLSAEARVRGAATALGAGNRPGSVAAAATAAGLGQSQFHALFRRLHGVSPKQLQLSRLMEEAADRLAAGNEPISEIAYALGYSDVSSFNRIFKRRLGMTPGEFRTLSRGTGPI